MPVIQVDDLAHEHPGGLELFSELNFRVGDGQHVAMIGANGVGKSTVLAGFEGTVLSVTHDRWFVRGFDRYVVFDHDCTVTEVPDLERALDLVVGA